MPYCHLAGCTPVPRASTTDIVGASCAEWGVSRELVVGPRRDRVLVRCRLALALRLREHGLTLRQIGQELGGRDHTTIMSLLRGGKHKETHHARP